MTENNVPSYEYAPEVAANAKLNNHRLYSPPVSSSTISMRKKFLLPIKVLPSPSSPEAKASDDKKNRETKMRKVRVV